MRKNNLASLQSSFATTKLNSHFCLFKAATNHFCGLSKFFSALKNPVLFTKFEMPASISLMLSVTIESNSYCQEAQQITGI